VNKVKKMVTTQPDRFLEKKSRKDAKESKITSKK
jgi:hypothetical protein